MATQSVEPCTILPWCPVCGGKMDLVHDGVTTKVCECVDCHTSITVPASAWDVAKDHGWIRP